ncbi:hypothetical protein Sros_3045 [Streptosporangium roseum DSM 43021]|uniref:Uncharacterized protein n=1 Tax=Streptosporangium roseum (strain ATCC 12428 / DSM 43021 / JCM 3005 / KCTC 9067 / NCIMB 10171 / NRRL 2505 / NI 9100) TaxID=479432 RepID=D2B9Y4_STRRD|nr:hypothetical protein Sros_3045 [Streptosporangium roseum DSM 43021]
MSYREVTARKLRTRASPAKPGAVGRSSHERIDEWIHPTQTTFPIIQDRGYGQD